MTQQADHLATWAFGLAHAVPTILAVGGFAAARVSPSARTGWRTAQGATLVAAGTAAAAFGVGLAAPGAAALQGTVLLLVALIGAALARFSATYLQGEHDQPRFAGWLLTTLAGATLVVATDHMLVLMVAWLATSLCLQNLLVFYRERPIAQLAAHKKFLCSRAADLCMLAAVLLLVSGPEELRIGALAEHAGDGFVAVAMMLVVFATLLKSAQLPFHGWLMQVMEAPTPVSALLHAGVVNLGGYVLIRLAQPIADVPAAQAVLVVVGSLTAVLAGLIATTRVSVKVALAWSTCAQMGFMLLQCGLGLYAMALLHLVGHSIYKAHAFLSANAVVQQRAVARITPSVGTPGVAVRLGAALVALATLFCAVTLFDPAALERPGLLAMMFVVVMAAGAMPRRRQHEGRAAALLHGAARAVLVASIWFGLHVAVESSGIAPAIEPPVALAWVAVAAFAGLALLDLLRTDFAHLPVSVACKRWFQEGVHLDGWFTRLTLRVFRWRPQLAERGTETSPLRDGDRI